MVSQFSRNFPQIIAIFRNFSQLDLTPHPDCNSLPLDR